MKYLATYALLLLVCIQPNQGFSQSGNKPSQFSNFPDVINCTVTELDKVFSLTPGQPVSLSFSDNFIFNGAVTGNTVKYNNLQGANIKSPFFHNSLFNISKRVNDDNSITYVGRIINRNYFDGYELRKNTDGNYQLIKIETDKVIQDCSQL